MRIEEIEGEDLGMEPVHSHAQQLRDIDGAKQVRVKDLQMGDQVLENVAEDPRYVLQPQNLLTVLEVQDRGATLAVTYQLRDSPVDYPHDGIVLVKA